MIGGVGLSPAQLLIKNQWDNQISNQVPLNSFKCY